MRYVEMRNRSGGWDVLYLEENNATNHIWPLHPPVTYATLELAQAECEKLNKQMEAHFDHNEGVYYTSVGCVLDNLYPVLTDKKNVQPSLDDLNAKEKGDD